MENKSNNVLLKIFLTVGIIAGLCVIAKIIYDKYKKNLCCLCEDECDCDFECLENDELDCDCDNCQYLKREEAVEVTEEAIEE